MIVFVSGFQRCGSSLMCQMLAAGGMPVYHDREMGYPSFETMRQFHDASNAEWIQSLEGSAVKWLEPQRAMPVATPNEVRVLWMARKYREQARSAVKFLKHVGGFSIPSGAWRAMEASYRRDTPKVLAAWRKRGPVLTVQFEELLARPEQVAGDVVRFLGLSLDAAAMASEVISRPPQCHPGFLELGLVRRV